MAVGYAMGRLGWMTASEKRFLGKYIINIAVPCSCVTGLLNNLDHDSLFQAGIMVLAAMSGIVVTLALSLLVSIPLHLPRERWGVFVAMSFLSNTLFIGLPVSTQLFGEACTPYVMMYYLANTTFLQSVGLLLVERSGTKAGRRITPKSLLKDLITKPPILAVLFAILLLLLDLRLPAPIITWGSYISDSVSPMALIYCGFIVYEVRLKSLRLMPGLPTMLILRLAVAPVICYVFCLLFGVTGLARDVFLVESALPVVTQVTVLAGAYGADEKYAATGACLSIFGCCISLPVLMLLIS